MFGQIRVGNICTKEKNSEKPDGKRAITHIALAIDSPWRPLGVTLDILAAIRGDLGHLGGH